jgi:hypothetical protein
VSVLCQLHKLYMVNNEIWGVRWKERGLRTLLSFKVITRDLFCNLHDVTLLCRWVRSGKGGYFKGNVKNYANIVLRISYGRNMEYHMPSEKRAQFNFDITGIFAAGTRRCQPQHYNLQQILCFYAYLVARFQNNVSEVECCIKYKKFNRC